MYNQNSPASGAKWFFFLAMVILLVTFALGFNVKDATWLNREIAIAQADRIKIENAHQQATYELQERLAAAKTEAEIKEIQRQQSRLDAQYQHDIQALSQDLAHRDLAFRTWMTVLTILASAFALAFLISSIILVVSKARVYVHSNLSKEVPMAKYVPPVKQWIPNLPERQPYDALKANQILFEKRLKERWQEITAEREKQKDLELLAARMKYITDPAKMSGDKRNKLPLAAD
jgi:ABC-type multidrug transport system fused ATPase/permease subunit